MGAAAAVGFQLPDENLPQNLELQAAANWHRIIKHANNGGSSASAPGSSDREVAFVSRGPQRLFEVYTSGSHTPHALPMEESVAPNVFRTVMHPSEDEKNGMLADLKANSKVFQISERVPTSMRLSRRSGNTLVLEWDCGDDAQALADASVQLGAVLPAGVRYEVIAGKGQSSAVQWHLIFCDQLEARSLAVRCSECDTLYHFRCRRLIPSQADSAAKTESWTPGSWGPQVRYQ